MKPKSNKKKTKRNSSLAATPEATGDICQLIADSIVKRKFFLLFLHARINQGKSFSNIDRIKTL